MTIASSLNDRKPTDQFGSVGFLLVNHRRYGASIGLE